MRITRTLNWRELAMKPATILCSLVALCSTLLYAQTSSVVGTVVNDDGEPITGANLCTRIATPNGSSDSCNGITTDDKGAFTISQLPLSKIEVYADVAVQGYSQDDSVKKAVTLTPQAPVARVRLTVGPKPGVLEINVTDKTTGKTLSAFFVRIITDSGGGYCAGSAHFRRPYSGVGRVPLSAGTEEIVEVRAPGYKSWFYTDPADPSRPVLRMASGEQKTLEVELEPK